MEKPICPLYRSTTTRSSNEPCTARGVCRNGLPIGICSGAEGPRTEAWATTDHISSDPGNPIKEFNYVHYHRAQVGEWCDLERYDRYMRDDATTVSIVVVLPIMFRSTILVVLALPLVVVLGCTNYLDECVQADRVGNYEAAIAPCQAATKGSIPRDVEQARSLLTCVESVVECSKEDADLEKIAEACAKAVAKGGDSKPKCAADAADRLAALKPKLDQARAEAAAKKAALDAEALKAARSKVRGKNRSLQPDSTCTGKALPPYRVQYEGGTYDEDGIVAQADGCQHLHEPGRGDVRDTFFCCPKLVTGSADLMNNNW